MNNYLTVLAEGVAVLLVVADGLAAFGEAEADAVTSGRGDSTGLGLIWTTDASGVGVGAKVAIYFPLNQTR